MNEDGPAADWLEVNRANWDERAAIHEASAFYDVPGFVAGRSTLRAFEVEEVSDVSGRTLVHLQCHLGQDTLSWARLGARVTGIDFSEPAVRTARDLAERIGAADRARFVVSDVDHASDAVGGERFDIVYTGLGALVWLPDLVRWASVVASLLEPGGFLYLAEFHPLADVLDDDGRTIVRDYFATSAREEDYPYTYTDGPPMTRTRQVLFPHTLGEVVSAVAAAGLRVDWLHERDTTLWRQVAALRPTDGAYGFGDGQPRVPLMYTLRASRAM